ncbi:transcriptional activator domain containing protein [Aminomonas paucivorans DSM 12260]|uniref:Transcriptional activator domain containing protein n=1 Tax=Aminomonas paucivorans DSM 12260 TaxID=584708 RepID=E3CYY9_9BACT|nr:AAA family ATPase [Aminomonas paucivorans]EFQ24584.1 transcriptional activator domain containing protein [Aminomonas paucivorans DSM 12260]
MEPEVLRGRLLGPPRFLLGERELSFPFRKVEALLVYVLLEGKASRESLASLFWGGRDEVLAARNLRNALYQLRLVLPEGVVLADRVWVVRGDYPTDLDLEGLDRLGEDEDLAARCVRPVLEGFSLPDSPEFDEWLRTVRSRWESRGRRALLDLARRRAALSPPGALGPLRRLLEADGGDEEAARILMDCLGRLGQLRGVEGVHRALVRRLREDLGVPPEEATEATYREALGRCRRGLEVGGEPSPSSSPERGFFGRTEERVRAVRFLEEPGDLPRVLCVDGEAGVGKTCLARACLETLAPETLVLRGNAVQGGERFPLLPWNDLLRGLARPGGGTDFRDLGFPESLWSLLGETFPSLGVRSTSFQPADPGRLGAVLAALFDRLSSRRPVALFLEDLHGFDGPSLDVLESVLAHGPGGIRLLSTSRPAPDRRDRRIYRGLERGGRIRLLSLTLRPFSLSETRDFCAFLQPCRPFDPREVESLFRRTEGLPLFLTELLRDPRGPLCPGGEELDGVMEGFLAGLAPVDRRTLECLAAFEGPAALDLLRETADPETEDLEGRLECLRERALLTEDRTGGETTVDFGHSLVREHLYRTLPEGRRRSLHRSLAEALGRRAAANPGDGLLEGRLIHHCRRGGLRREELTHRIRSLRRHIALYYELFPLLSDEELRSSSTFFGGRDATLERLEETRSLLGDLKRSQEDRKTLESLEREYRAIRGGFHLWWGESDQGRALVEAALERASEGGDRRVEADCLKHLGYDAIQREDGAELEGIARRLLPLCGGSRGLPWRGMALRFLGLARLFLRDHGEAERFLLLSMDRFRDLEALDEPYRFHVLAARGYLGECRHRQGRLEEARALYDACLEECRREGFFRGLGFFHGLGAQGAFDAGDREGLARHLSGALGEMAGLPWSRGDAPTYALAAWEAAGRGDGASAVEHLGRAARLCESLNKRSWTALLELVKGLLPRMRELEPLLPDPPEASLARAEGLCRDLGMGHRLALLERLREGRHRALSRPGR